MNENWKPSSESVSKNTPEIHRPASEAEITLRAKENFSKMAPEVITMLKINSQGDGRKAKISVNNQGEYSLIVKVGLLNQDLLKLYTSREFFRKFFESYEVITHLQNKTKVANIDSEFVLSDFFNEIEEMTAELGTENKVNFCSKCGAKIEADWKFCGDCGASVDAMTAK